jgi:hypothetical protein
MRAQLSKRNHKRCASAKRSTCREDCVFRARSTQKATYIPWQKSLSTASRSCNILRDPPRILRSANPDSNVPTNPIFAQDPEYTANDVQILSEMSVSIKTLDDPQGFLDIDSNTFVMFTNCEIHLHEMIATAPHTLAARRPSLPTSYNLTNRIAL